MSDSAPAGTPSPGFVFTEPRQARSRRTLERIVQAARELIAERGVDGVTVLEIVERAGSSIGSFYARFPGKDELVGYLDERVRADGVEQWEAAVAARDWEALDFRGTAEALIGDVLDFCRSDAAWRRAFLGASGAEDGSHAGATPRPLQERILQDFLRLLLRWSPEITHADPERAVRIGFRILVGGIRELGAGEGGVREAGESDEASRETVDAERLQAELSRSYLSYLGARGAPARDLLMDDPFNIWA